MLYKNYLLLLCNRRAGRWSGKWGGGEGSGLVVWRGDMQERKGQEVFRKNWWWGIGGSLLLYYLV